VREELACGNKKEERDEKKIAITFKKVQHSLKLVLYVHRCIDGFFIFHWKNEHMKPAHKWERNEEKVTNTQNILSTCSQKKRNIYTTYF